MVIAGAAVLAFVHLVANYWAYYAIGSSGSNGLALIGFVAPLATILFLGAAAGTYYLAGRLGLREWRRAFTPAVAVTIVFVTFFAGEVWRTADYPTERPKRFAAFLGHYLGVGDP